jgi:hypothetical protein
MRHARKDLSHAGGATCCAGCCGRDRHRRFGAPIITVIASNSAQDASFRHHRALSDREEVRKVVDTSANDLNRTYFLLTESGACGRSASRSFKRR